MSNQELTGVRNRQLGPRKGRLANGMVIIASLRARVLGFRLLTLDADIAVTPELGADRRRVDNAPARRVCVSSHASPARSNGAGRGLAAAARSLEASAAELAAARERMS